MKKKYFVLLTLLIFNQNLANAADVVKVGDLTLTSAWSRASTSIKRPNAVYLSITNSSSTQHRLNGANTPTAKRAEIHRHFMDNGVMRMRHVDFMEVPAASKTVLKPGGVHIMLFELASLLKEGELFPISLTFQRAGKAKIMVQVAKVGAKRAHKHNAKNLHNLKSNVHEKHGNTHLKHGNAPAK